VSARRSAAVRWVVRLPVRYCVTLGVIVVPIIATLIARHALGPDPTPQDVAELGYGLPALQEGRWWTLFTGMVLVDGLAIPLPSFTVVAVALYEHVARHWRTIVALVGGQLLGVLLTLAAVVPLQDSTSPFAREVTTVLDFGISVGGFACMGAWTAYLRAPLRRPIRWAVSCYQLGPLLLSGLIFDLSHPAGWFLGLLAGPLLMRPRPLHDRPLRRRDVGWIVLGIAIGTTIGVIAGWNGGGPGGIFGWGPAD
jgi:phosphatidylglycerol lysyltransferase